MENIYITEKSKDYELLDSGDGRKLERYGEVTISRPDPQALWQKSLGETEWKKANASFEQDGLKVKWKILNEVPKDWKVTFDKLVFNLQLLPSKHIGVFPEQSYHWKWLEEKIKLRYEYTNHANNTNNTNKNAKINVLNLFGYTGGSSLACAIAGAEVCHVDASEFAVDLAMKNRDSSGLKDAPIRFIIDDVRKFVEREIKRGKKYDVIIMDPPVYGKGVKKEVWKIEEDLVPLLSRVKEIISDSPIAIILNGYSSRYSHITYKQMLENITSTLGGSLSSGELAIKQSQSERLLRCGIFARWKK